MPEKKKKGKAKAKKAPAYVTSPESLEPYGFQVGEAMQTPLCMTATVLGVKAVDGRIWVEYSSGMEAPLLPAAEDGPLTALGYEKLSPMELTLRELKALEDDVTKWHKKQGALVLAKLEKGKGGAKGKPAAKGKKKK